MNITEIPFNKFIGLSYTEESNYLLMLSDNKEYYNHLGTVHASALFALAEATSGHFLLTQFPELIKNIIPVVRKSETKFKKPANGRIFSKASIIDDTIDNIKKQLSARKRILIKLSVELFDDNEVKIFSGIFEWFVSLNHGNN